MNFANKLASMRRTIGRRSFSKFLKGMLPFLRSSMIELFIFLWKTKSSLIDSETVSKKCKKIAMNIIHNNIGQEENFILYFDLKKKTLKGMSMISNMWLLESSIHNHLDFL